MIDAGYGVQQDHAAAEHGTADNAVNIAVEDLFSATLFVLENAEQWQIDTEKIITSGSSAGAISVLQAENAICNRTSSAAVLPQGFNYAGVISYAGESS